MLFANRYFTIYSSDLFRFYPFLLSTRASLGSTLLIEMLYSLDYPVVRKVNGS